MKSRGCIIDGKSNYNIKKLGKSFHPTTAYIIIQSTEITQIHNVADLPI